MVAKQKIKVFTFTDVAAAATFDASTILRQEIGNVFIATTVSPRYPGTRVPLFATKITLIERAIRTYVLQKRPILGFG